MNLETLIEQIQPLDNEAMQQARLRQDDLTKPRGSLGRLEEISILVAGMTGRPFPSLENKVIATMAGDHGVVQEGVSAYPSDVTYQMVLNFLHGGAAINVFANHINARVVIADLGVAEEFEDLPGLTRRKIAPGTGNIAREPAMSPEQALEALQAGVEIAAAEHQRGMDILATGEMGIGNTTPSAAIACVLTGRDPEIIVGRGTGVDDQGLARKVTAVRQALQSNQPNPEDSLDILSKVGGFEIGGLTGAVLYAAANRIPVVIDGFISTAAAMLAVQLSPNVRHYLISAHRSQERGHQLMLDWLELNPLLQLGMRLGEGTGAALAVSLVEAACKILSEMATFSEAGVTDKE
jgi:nicotinate-nucleotide--dimethylbenzimidazole phosphoribosyltransferase